MAFLFLPMNNGYEGLDSGQTLLAGTLFLFFATLFDRELEAPSGWRLSAIAVLSALITMTRGEYLVLQPFYLVISWLGSHFVSERRPISRSRCGVAFAAAVLGLILGVVGATAFRYSVTGKLGMVPPAYSCWTFLDGVPASWLAASDETEFARRVVGVRRFGHPSEYDYSLARMILANPGATLEKFIGNIPRWLFELGGRAQVLSKPAAALAVVGLLALVRFPFVRRRRLLAVHMLCTMGMTIPMIAVMLYAEYLRPAYPAMCFLMAYGGRAIAVGLHRVFRGISRRVFFGLLCLALCLGMEFLYFYSDAHHPDAPVLTSIAQEIDVIAREYRVHRMVLDPYSGEIDASCRSSLWNHILEDEYLQREGRSTTEPYTDISVSILYRASSLSQRTNESGRHAVVVWSAAGEQAELQRRVDRWEGLGFRKVDTRKLFTGQPQEWEIALLVNHAGD